MLVQMYHKVHNLPEISSYAAGLLSTPLNSFVNYCKFSILERENNYFIWTQ